MKCTESAFFTLGLLACNHLLHKLQLAPKNLLYISQQCEVYCLAHEASSRLNQHHLTISLQITLYIYGAFCLH